MKTVIELRDLNVGYFTFNQGVNSIKDIFTAFKFIGLFQKRNILKDVNLNIHEGEILGVIGRNGTGKTTLLKTIGGILQPNSGSIEVHRKIAPMLSLGIGVEMELSGYENIHLIASIMGLTRSAIKSKIESIREFSELSHETLQAPVKTYSSGMSARLAFSIAFAEMPEVLLVDEVLAVGDASFQEKCMNRILDIRKKGCTIVYVSHSMQQIRDICTRAICIEDQGIAIDGDVEEVINFYEKNVLKLN